VNTVLVGGARLHSGNGTELVGITAPAWPNEESNRVHERGLFSPYTQRCLKATNSPQLLGRCKLTAA
jgi:hypothetical protein